MCARVHVCMYVYMGICVWRQGDEYTCMFDVQSVHMHVVVHVFTCDFSDSGTFADLITTLLFFWQSQHRSDIGFMTVMCGVSCLHNEQKVVYAAALNSVSSQASLRSIQTACSGHARYVQCVL